MSGDSRRTAVTSRDSRRLAAIRATYDGRRRAGRAIDLRETELSASTVDAAIRESGTETETGIPTGAAEVLTIDCPSVDPLYEYVGVLRSEMRLDLRGALATLARSLGHTSDAEAELSSVREELADLSPPEIDLGHRRERVAAAGADEAELEERVATLRGRVQALRDCGTDEELEDAREALADAIAQLSDVRTERIAAEEALEAERRAARSVRDRRERRLRLQDREHNLERRARSELAAAVYDRFAAAIERVPGDATPGDEPSAYDGDDLTAALAIARAAPTDVPVVVACDRFESPTAAARRLGTPVIRV